ncbi:MAG: hypothetical protein GC129_06125 [Proteobacteria bacterium]|nr:hypothetical protein [Pseudomonadota bacterium]
MTRIASPADVRDHFVGHAYIGRLYDLWRLAAKMGSFKMMETGRRNCLDAISRMTSLDVSAAQTRKLVEDYVAFTAMEKAA